MLGRIVSYLHEFALRACMASLKSIIRIGLNAQVYFALYLDVPALCIIPPPAIC